MKFAGGQFEQRRGSFLVAVVAILALLTVLTIVYVSIGRADAQIGAAVLRERDRGEPETIVRDYIAQIIADDLFELVDPSEVPNLSVQQPLLREAWDYPSTPYAAIFFHTANNRIERYPVTVGGDPRSTALFTPTGEVIVQKGANLNTRQRIGTGTDPWLASTEPTVIDFAGVWTSPEDYPFLRNDFPQISILAPDGAFVNKFNLRSGQAGFNATPWQMRQNLNLYSPDRSDNRGLDTDFGATATLSGDPTTRPFFWGARQIDAHRPIGDRSFTVDDPEYALYQWADADGDGILDARWFELIEDRDPADPASRREILSRVGNLRYFIAATVKDLSASVNINTATDATLAASRDQPAGMSPSHVDLRRMLTLQDFSPDRDDGIAAAGLNLYESFVFNEAYERLDDADSFQAGDRAYDTLRLVLSTGRLADAGYQGLVDAAGGANLIDGEFFFDSTDFFINNELYGGGGQLGYYLDTGRTDPIAGSRWNEDQYRVAPLFGIDSLEELVAFRGLNDPSRTSRLESALFGRGQNLAEVGPLRSNIAAENQNLFDQGEVAGRSDRFIAKSLLDVRRRLTTISGHRPIFAADMGLPTSPDNPRLIQEDLRTPLNGFLLGDPDALFRVYADALLPWSDYRVGPLNAWTSRELAPLAYAGQLFASGTSDQYGPELALRIAAHMTVNMVDIMDNDHDPTRRTLLVDETRRADIVVGTDTHAPGHPYPLLDLNQGATRLAQNASELLDSSGNTGRAVNVFGIEAQPFITMAGAMAVYSDVPEVFGGNPDPTSVLVPNPPGPDEERFIPNIDMNFAFSNSDFLFELFAVELTNPFDQPIMLSGKRGNFDTRYAENEDITSPDHDGRFTYYIQFGEVYYRLADHRFTSGNDRPSTRTAIMLEPGQSRVFYCLSQTPDQVMARLASASGDAIASNADEFVEWARQQLGDDAVLMWPMATGLTVGDAQADLQDGVPLPATALTSQLLNQLNSGNPTDREVVRLWYAERPELLQDNPQIDGVDESATRNDPITDVLVDRLRVPSLDAGLLSNVRRDDTDQDVVGALPSLDNQGDNRGLTIAQWAGVRRSGDPEYADFALETFKGVFPAWCVEPVDNFISNKIQEDPEGSGSSAFNITDFNSVEYAADTLSAWWGNTGAATPSATVIPEIAYAASDEQRNEVGTLPNTGDRIGNNAANIPVEELRVEHRLSYGTFTTIAAPRLADLLLPLGIGPMHDPGADLFDGSDDQWLTLSEALAHAMGYDADGVPNNFDSALVTFYDQMGVYNTFDESFGTDATPWHALFLGQLYSDTFVPFFDTNGDAIYNPRANNGTDMPWGLRITPSMRLIQSVVGFDRQTASLARPLMGTININTAPLEVLRTLPMLSPPVDDDPVLGSFIGSFSGGSESLWWWTNAAGTGNPPPHDQQSDIAATMVAYRDRLRLWTRSPAGSLPELLDFLGDSSPNNEPPGYDLGDTGQGAAHQISGTSERPGFRSIGEVLAVRDFGTGGLHDIDRLIADGTSISQPGTVSTLYRSTDINNPDDLIDDGLINDYDEQFIIANSIFNSISVGSDYYAVWFLLHGYSEQDTQVAAGEPLVPTVARRFVMVVDRSNVVQRGEAPRIVLFREVPVELP